MFTLKVIDEKFSENNLTERSENPFELLYKLSQIYGPELVAMMYGSLMKGRTFRYYHRDDHGISVTLAD